MDMNTLSVGILVAVAAGAVAYVFIYPLLSGEARAEKRQRALVGEGPSGRTARAQAGPGANRRDQVAQSLKDLEARQKARHKITLESRIQQAGLGWSRNRFFAFSAALAVAVGLCALIATGKPLAALGGFFVGAFGLPRWILGYLKNRRISRFLEELPNAMDVIIRGLRSGLPLNDCVRVIATEAQEPVRTEFRHIVEAQTLGISLGDAIGKMYERVPVTEANFLAIVIAIQQKSGGNLSEALTNLSKVLRDRKKMKGKIKAMSSEAKASAGIIACLPFTVALLTYLSSPQYIELLWKTSAGTVAMVIAGMWMTMGVLVMKKMISFDF
jgi:tight adherence protein B